MVLSYVFQVVRTNKICTCCFKIELNIVKHVILTQPMDPEKTSLNFIFPTKYVIPKSLKFSHWPSKNIILMAMSQHPSHQPTKRASFINGSGYFVFGYTPAVEKTNKKKRKHDAWGKKHTHTHMFSYGEVLVRKISTFLF